MTPYQYNAKCSRFRDPSTGRFISRATVRRWLDRDIAVSQRRIQAVSNQLRAGEITLTEWHDVMREEIKRTHGAAEVLLRGGRKQMRAADWGRVGQRVREQYRFLDRFTEELRAARVVTDGRFLNRAAMYAASARTGFHEGLSELLDSLGYTEERNRLHPAEHCFPAGTLVRMPGGERPIESIRVGDVVATRFGCRRVTRTFRRRTSEALVRVRAGGREVLTTPNHPFLTARGWVSADALDLSRDVVFVENRLDDTVRHVGFPNTLDGVAAFSKVRISRAIALLLGLLLLAKSFVFRMSVPPIAVGLNDQSANQNIDDELGFDDRLRFENDAVSLKNRPQSAFKAARVTALKSCNPSQDFSSKFGIQQVHPRLRAQSIMRIGAARGVVGDHVLTGARMNDTVARGLVQAKFQLICALSNLYQRSTQFLGTLGSPEFAVIGAKESDLRCSEGTGAFGAPLAPPVLSVAARADRPRMDRPRPAVATDVRQSPPANATFGAGALGRIGLAASRISTRHENNLTVFNLQVDDVSEYVANGFVVHNCDVCLDMTALGWQPIGTLIPVGQRTCRGNDRCDVIYR